MTKDIIMSQDLPITLRLDLNARQDEESFQDLFVQRIREAFEISQWGEVTASTLHTDEGTGEPLAASVMMTVPSLHDKQVTGLATLLEQFGAPVGSRLTITRGDTPEVHTLGKVHGIAIYLDGVNLDKKIYKKYDLDDIWDAINHELGDQGMAYGYWQGSSETAIYAYGPHTNTMEINLERLLAKHPLCRGSRSCVLPNELPDVDGMVE